MHKDDQKTFGETVSENDAVSDHGSANDIKVEGVKRVFPGGAIRYDKGWKGRFDLIPEDVFERLNCLGSRLAKEPVPVSKEDAVNAAWKHDYLGAIFVLTIVNYGTKDQKEVLASDSKSTAEKQDIITFLFCRMVADLAKHFQKGAEKYGPRNCQRGIPLDSFRDSGLRHLCQYIMGYEDEPHLCAAIWNFWMADWTIHLNDRMFPLEEPEESADTLNVVDPANTYRVVVGLDKAGEVLTGIVMKDDERTVIPKENISIVDTGETIPEEKKPEPVEDTPEDPFPDIYCPGDPSWPNKDPYEGTYMHGSVI